MRPMYRGITTYKLTRRRPGSLGDDAILPIHIYCKLLFWDPRTSDVPSAGGSGFGIGVRKAGRGIDAVEVLVISLAYSLIRPRRRQLT